MLEDNITSTKVHQWQKVDMVKSYKVIVIIKP